MLFANYFYLAILTFSVGCSSPSGLEDNITKLNKPKPVKLENTSSVESKLFKLIKIDNVKNNQRNYLIDLNGDNISDLVYLKESYSIPYYSIYSLKTKKFSIGKRFKGFNKRASFLDVIDFSGDGHADIAFGTFYQNKFMPKEPTYFFRIEKVIDEYVLQKIYEEKITSGLPITSINKLDFNRGGDFSIFYSAWLTLNDSEGPRPVQDVISDGEKSSGLISEEREKANFGSSVCDLDGDFSSEILLPSTTGDNIEYIKFDMNLGRPVKKALFESTEESFDGIFADCVFFPNMEKPHFLIGRIGHDYLRENKFSGVYTQAKKPIFLFESPEGSYQHRSIIKADLNGDVFPDFILENTGFPPHSKLEIYLSDSEGSYSRVPGLNIVNPAGIVTGDFNDDGKVDLLFGQSSQRLGPKISHGALLINRIKPLGRSIRFYFREFRNYLNGESGQIIVHTNRGFIKKMINYKAGGLGSSSARFIQVGLGNAKIKRVEFFISNKNYSFPISSSNSKFLKYTLCENGEFKLGDRRCSD